jgi:ABC-type glycerol-3-phosphate transport system substrate-binding protein
MPLDDLAKASPLSRRSMLRLLAGGTAASLLAACSSVTPPGVTPGVAGTPPAAGAPAATPAGGNAAAATPVPTPVPEREAASGRKTTIEVYTAYSGAGYQTVLELADMFEKSQPDIGVRVVFAGTLPDNETKTFAAVAGGKAPDVAWVDGPQVSSWAVQGVLQPIDQYLSAAGLKESDYWPPSWKQNLWKGQVYALTLTSDANFGFFWNKGLFKDGGLDPEKPPTTIEEATDMADKLSKVENDRIIRLGMVPWTVYGSPNSMYTWGWVFGGDFYDEASGKITADHPANVAALEWMVDRFAKKYDPARVSGFQAGFGTGENGPFHLGYTAMQPLGNWEIASLQQFHPDLQYGITYMPQGPNNAPPHSSWVGGWCLGIPKGAKNPEAGFQFMNYIAGTGEGVDYLAKQRNFFPGYMKAKIYSDIQNDPKLGQFYNILKETQHQRPVIPVQSFYSKALGKALDDAVLGGKNPKDALAEATTTTQRELDSTLKRYGA